MKRWDPEGNLKRRALAGEDRCGMCFYCRWRRYEGMQARVCSKISADRPPIAGCRCRADDSAGKCDWFLRMVQGSLDL